MPTRLPVLAMILALLVLCAGCPRWGDDDDAVADDDDLFGDDDDATTTDDDDATGDDDDDSTNDPGAPEYAEDEAWFALAPGNTWRYTETRAVVPIPESDSLDVRVVRRLLASSIGDWSPEVTAIEVLVDRLSGEDEVHFIGLSGTGAAIWLGTEIRGAFESEFIEGDGGTLLRRSDDLSALVDATFDAAWLVTDDGPTDVEATANGEAPYLYDEGPAEGVDCLELELGRNGSTVGLQYFKPQWGLLGMELDLSGEGLSWEIEACSACPPEAGLPRL